jgi:hypothetical protein
MLLFSIVFRRSKSIKQEPLRAFILKGLKGLEEFD